MTQTHPGIPDELRGTYAGLGHPAVIDHLKSLNVTAIELMPVHQFMHDHRLLDLGLRNYWGYNTFGFFAPHYQYSSTQHAGSAVAEFKTMVRSFHDAGIEVILDVVYNHTAEGNHLGPTINFRGIDNAAYYRLLDDDKRFYKDFTGTGNSLNARHPHTLQLIMDSLRYWVLEMHVDGFRFDLASTLAREFYDVDRLSAFFDLVQQDPVISQVKLIAEPWDVGEGGYQVGNFPGLWTEWNGKYRDTVRDYWRGEPATLGEFASRLTGSSDLYEATGRRPSASINFVTCHDGFTLADLVSYNDKHNEANGEDNRDGESHNRSWNCGVEGPTDDPAIMALRHQQMRNILATLMLSQGTPPMIAHGDEIGRTQQGNNNVYCQDSPLSWMDWTFKETNAALLEFTTRVTALRKAHPVFRRRRFFDGEPLRTGDQVRDIAWLTTAGQEMSHDDWNSGFKFVGVFLNGEAIPEPNARGERVVDDSFLLCFNAHKSPIEFTVPDGEYAQEWSAVLDTSEATGTTDAVVKAGETISVPSRSVLVLQKDCLAGTGSAMAYPVLSTYRLQLRGASAGDAFTFADAEKLIPYLDDLGVSHLYLSPILTAAPGSTHGYDVTDPTTVSEELGGAEGLARLADAAKARGLGLVVDIVPNHVGGVDQPQRNPWWWDVLQHGRQSPPTRRTSTSTGLSIQMAESCCRSWDLTAT